MLHCPLCTMIQANHPVFTLSFKYTLSNKPPFCYIFLCVHSIEPTSIRLVLWTNRHSTIILSAPTFQNHQPFSHSFLSIRFSNKPWPCHYFINPPTIKQLAIWRRYHSLMNQLFRTSVRHSTIRSLSMLATIID